jgi:hypothetical protein
MDLEKLAADLKAGNITLAEWESAMRDYLRQQYEAAMVLVKGGRDNITQSDWGYEGSLLKKQYAFLNNFANDIAKNPESWMNGRLNNRMNLYKESAYSALEDMNRREHAQNGFDEERRVLGEADHCPGCLEQAGQGWQPIGTLDPIGAEECVTNCKCEFEYRRSTDMLFAPAERETTMLFSPAQNQ